jgi:hypothetical protein
MEFKTMLDANLRAAGVHIDADTLAEIEAIRTGKRIDNRT